MNKEKTKGYSTVGMSFSGTLTLIFVVLKLLHVIDWSWLWVLSPLWISWIIGIVIILMIVIIAIIARVL